MGVSDGNRECVEVLCACEELVTSQRDRWNRTPMNSASEECRKLIRNRGEFNFLSVTHFFFTLIARRPLCVCMCLYICVSV